MSWSGLPINKLAVSTDETAGNLVNIHQDVVQSARFSPGRSATALPKGSAGNTTYVEAKADPFVTVTVDPNTDTSGAALIFSTPGMKYIELSFNDPASRLTNGGMRVVGLALITDDGGDHSIGDQVTTMTFTFRPASNWSWINNTG